MIKKKKLRCIISIILTLFIVLNIVAIVGVTVAYNSVFCRADFDEYNTDCYYTYDEIDGIKYKRELLNIKSGENTLSGFLYNTESTQGIIIVSPGHRDFSDIKLSEIMYFINNGWMVISYDYTGCYGSEGNNMVGYTQAPTDLDAVLTYVENDSRVNGLPIMLFGHSLGAYASTAVLQNENNITAVVAASGFDDPMEQWNYSVKRFTGIFGNSLSPYANLLMKLKFGDMAHFSAIDGINSTDVPILIMQGTTDEFYGDVSSIYAHKDSITNPNCSIQIMDDENHHGHYDYFLSENALKYQKQVKNGEAEFPIDKFLYLEHDDEIMNYINQFYLNALN